MQLNSLQAGARALFENYRKVSAKAPKPFFNIQTQEADDEATLYIYDVIDSWFGVDVSQLVDELNNLDVSHINVRLSSPGGSVQDGLAIMSALANHKATIHTYADSIVASMASGILMAGEKIFASESATIMIHYPWLMTAGNSRDLRKIADIMDGIGGQLARNYSKQTESRGGLTHAEVVQAMAEETWYSAEKAKDAGLVDELIDVVPVKNAGNMQMLSAYRNTPDHLKNNLSANEQHSKKIETIRDFENFLRDVGGYTNTVAKKIAAAGFMPDQRDVAAMGEDIKMLLQKNSNILKGNDHEGD